MKEYCNLHQSLSSIIKLLPNLSRQCAAFLLPLHQATKNTIIATISVSIISYFLVERLIRFNSNDIPITVITPALRCCISEAVDVEWIISETDRYSNWEERNNL